MNHQLHFALTALLLPIIHAAETVQVVNPCSEGQTGRVPTEGCKGYADCLNGSKIASSTCSAGTLYDSKSGICNWPAEVTCDYGDGGEETTDDDDDYVDDYMDEEDGDEIFAKFCPAGFTGKAPTTDCLGYVICTDGEEGLSAKCPTDSLFNGMTLRCEYGFNDCQLLVHDKETNLGKYAKFCPDKYSGKAPTKGCEGYVKCHEGTVTDALQCPTGTKFDVMRLACTYAEVQCGDETTEEEEEEDNEGENEQTMSKKEMAKYCPEEYTGRAPTKDCDGYVDCRKGQMRLYKDCPTGTKFDVMILACTFSEVKCEATIEATDYPTPSPFGKKDGPERVIVDESCPEDYTGNKAIEGCSGYIYCALGKQMGKFKCSAGLLFDVSSGYCNWAANVDTNIPECASSSPSFMPTLSPVYPTNAPSYSPTIFILEGELYYPDYKNGICKYDDNYPPSLSSMYLKSTAHGCCNTFFESTYDGCMQAFITDSPTISPTGEMSWYPDYDYNLCRSDLEYSDFEKNFFASYERCCEFDFLDTAECLMKKPSAMGLIYYPHYPSGTCLNDGRQSLDEVWLYTSKKDCCKNDQVQPFTYCMTGEANDGEMNPNSSGVTTTTTTTTPEIKEYYPDYENAICLSDGNVPEFEVNVFSTYEACCRVNWMDTEQCMANKLIHDSEKWYPIMGKGYCLNNGSPPDRVALSNTAKDCCKNFFSSNKKSCEDKSKKRWYPDYDDNHCKNDGNEPQGILMSKTYTKCCDRFMSSRRTQCVLDSESFEINQPSLTASPSKKPSKKPTQKPVQTTTTTSTSAASTDSCQNVSTKKRCNNYDSCNWIDGICSSSHSLVTTARPSLRPSHILSIINECERQTNKRKCAQFDICRWDDTFDNCVSLVAPIASGCKTLKNKRQCRDDTSCSWNVTFEICIEASLVAATTTTTTTTTTTITTISPTTKPTRRPRPEPTPKPSTSKTVEPPVQQVVSCGSYKKRACTSNGCQWDNASKKCIPTSDVVEESRSPTYLPTYSPINKEDSLEEMWYPILSQSQCVLLPSRSPRNDPYSTYVECCNNPWISDRDGCMDDAKTQLDPEPPSSPGEHKFYPDYFRGSCQNDGNQPASEENLYDTIDGCCKNEWLDYSRCKMISSDEHPPSNNMPNSNKYYPDYFFNVCRNDGKQPAAETYLFDNIEDCCGLEYMEYDGCVYLSN